MKPRRVTARKARRLRRLCNRARRFVRWAVRSSERHRFDLFDVAFAVAFRGQCGDTRAPTVQAAATTFTAKPVLWVTSDGKTVSR